MIWDRWTAFGYFCIVLFSDSKTMAPKQDRRYPIRHHAMQGVAGAGQTVLRGSRYLVVACGALFVTSDSLWIMLVIRLFGLAAGLRTQTLSICLDSTTTSHRCICCCSLISGVITPIHLHEKDTSSIHDAVTSSERRYRLLRSC